MSLTTAPTRLTLEPLSGSIGTVVHDLDVRDLDDATIAALRDVWLDRKVLFFPRQDLTPAEHVTFARRFGEVTESHPVIPGIDGQPEVFELDYSRPRELATQYGDVAYRRQGLDWHTDVTFVARPPLGSILRAVTIPERGGDTQWSDQQAAFADLSPALQDFLRGLHAVHDGRAAFRRALELVGQGQWEGHPVQSLEPVVHPVVRRHEETGAEVLFVNPGFTSHIVELSRRESDALLHFLYAHAVRPEFTVRFHWHAGDLGFWDNRATMHSVTGDFGDSPRVIQRVTLRGTAPVDA